MTDTPGAGPSRRVRPTAADFLKGDEDEVEPMDVDSEPTNSNHDWNPPDAEEGAQQGALPDNHQNDPARTHKKYRRRPDEKAEVLEDENLRLPDEDGPERNEHPLRILTNFVIVEVGQRRMRPINPGRNIPLQAIGYATRAIEPDEDVGQEDDGQEDEEMPEGTRIRTAPLQMTSCDYMKAINLLEITIETKHATYILRSPDEQYRELFAERMHLVKLTSLILSLGHDPMNAPEVASLDEFKAKAGGLVLGGKTCTNSHVKSAAYQVHRLLPSLPDEVAAAIRQHPVVVEALRLIDNRSVGYKDFTPVEHRRLQPPRPIKLSLTYNPDDPDDPARNKIDNDVMKPQNQTQNTVTPRMARLAKGWTAERLRLLGGEVGPRRRQWNKALYRQELEAAVTCARKAPKARLLVNPDGTRLVPDRKLSTKWQQPFRVHKTTYNVGDTVLYPRQDDFPDEIPENARMEDYFRFGKILFVHFKNGDDAHILWYDHSSQTALGLPPASDERELMLTARCEEVPVRELCGKVRVLAPGAGLKLEDGVVPDRIDAHYFCRLSYDRSRPSFTDLAPLPTLEPHETDPRGCPVCLHDEEKNLMDEPQWSERRGVITVTFNGVDYHQGDCVLFASGVEGEIPGPPGAGSLGRIVRLQRHDGRIIATVDQLVRHSHYEFDDASVAVLGIDAIKDPRQLLSTEHSIDVSAHRIVRKIFVQRLAHSEFIWMLGMNDIKQWLNASPDHFFIKWHWYKHTLVPTADGPPELPWRERKLVANMSSEDRLKVGVCEKCKRAKRHEYRSRRTFAENNEPIKILDLCAGTGAFSCGIVEGMGCRAKVTHAVEISPSAMSSFKAYSPDTTAFNTCINTFLDYTIKYNANEINPGDEWNNLDGSSFGVPPAPGEIDCIVVGFPCQPHSIMNMFKHDDDAKSNLIFTILSIVEYLKPAHIFFENVQGIKSFQLSPTMHVIPEGLKHSGLNFLCACLVALGYQISYQLMNAASHGAAQHRIRWFLIGAKVDEPMPNFPMPTHFYNEVTSLGLKVHPGSSEPAKPDRPAKGSYLYPHLTIRDAIEDLWTFDITNPGTLARQYNIHLPSEAALDREIRDLRNFRGVTDWNPGADEEDSMYLCCPENDYLTQPLNRLQLEARVDAPKHPNAQELQHYTRYWPEQTSEFICNIPMNKKDKRNYLGLPNGMQNRSRMLHDPTSANARHGHKGNYFARADKDGVFQTTVTNVGPAAKQSRCLHPWAYRMFTVRELARSQGFPDKYKFVALNNDVVTMHRQIGNAVPWPIGRALGREFGEVLYRKWYKERGQGI